MDIYFYSPIKALLSSNQFAPTTIEQNPLYHNGTKGLYARYDYGLSFEPSIVYFDDKFYKNIAIIDLYKGFLALPKLVKTYNLPYKIIDKQSIVCAQIECFVTCYQQGGAYLKIDGYNQSTTLELPFVPNKIELYNLGSNVFIIKAIKKLCFFAIIPILKHIIFDYNILFAIKQDNSTYILGIVRPLNRLKYKHREV